MRTAFFRVITQRVVVIPYISGQTLSSSRANSASRLKMRPIDCPETSARNYHHSLCNNPEERSSHVWTSFSSYYFSCLRFCEKFGTSKLHLFHLLFYKILNLKECVGGGNQTICYEILDQLQPAREKEGCQIIKFPGDEFISNFKIFIWPKVLKSTNN